MHWLRTVFLLVLPFFLCAAQQARQPDAQYLQRALARAVQLHQSGDLEKALTAYQNSCNSSHATRKHFPTWAQSMLG